MTKTALITLAGVMMAAQIGIGVAQAEAMDPVPDEASSAITTSPFRLAPGSALRAIVLDNIGPLAKGSDVLAELVPTVETPKAGSMTYALRIAGMKEASLKACIRVILNPDGTVRAASKDKCLGHVVPRRPLRLDDLESREVAEGQQVTVFPGNPTN